MKLVLSYPDGRTREVDLGTSEFVKYLQRYRSKDTPEKRAAIAKLSRLVSDRLIAVSVRNVESGDAPLSSVLVERELSRAGFLTQLLGTDPETEPRFQLMISDERISPYHLRICLELVDPEGKVVREVEGKERWTVWAEEGWALLWRRDPMQTIWRIIASKF